MSGWRGQGAEEGGQVLTETVGAHGHDGHAQDDVDAGEEDAEQVRVTVQSYSNGDHEREGVEETINQTDIMDMTHQQSAQHQVEQDGEETEPAGHLPPVFSWLLAQISRLSPGSSVAAHNLVVECLQVSAQESANQAYVEEEYWETNAGDTNRE